MGIGRTNFKGKVRIKGRPREQARAEIMVMKARERYEDKQRRRNLFLFLDIIAFGFFITGILFMYFQQDYVWGSVFILIAIFIVLYFIIRKATRKKIQNFSRSKKRR